MWQVMFPILCAWFGIAAYAFIGRLLIAPFEAQMKRWNWDSTTIEILGPTSGVFWPLAIPFWISIALPIQAAEKFPAFASSWKKKWKNRHAVVVQPSELLAALNLDAPPEPTPEELLDSYAKGLMSPSDFRSAYELARAYERER